MIPIACASAAPMGVPNSKARRAGAALAACCASRYSAIPGQVPEPTDGMQSRVVGAATR